jgi:hypothetical protein
VLKRFVFAASVILAGALSTASGEIADAKNCRPRSPSSFDYLVLASMADSARPFEMAAYRPQRNLKHHS